MRKSENLGIERSVFDAIRTRRSVRSFKTDKVSRVALRRILESGRWGPSPENLQPWHFVVVENQETIKQFLPTSRHAKFLDKVPCFIVMVVDPIARRDKWLSKLEQHKYAAGAAMQNMMLAAWEIGLGTCWVTIEERVAEKLLNIPRDRSVPGAIAIGYPQGPLMSHGERDRLPFEQVVYYERFKRKKR